MNKPRVTILCLAYNHAKFIRQCLDGFVMQKTNFKFEVLIHDDASTDGTTEIIKEYEKKYPDIIKPIYQTENQFSKGVSILKTYLFPNVKSKYVALCEGDDYWTDKYKLQKQVDFMETHPQYTGCFHPVKVIWEDSSRKPYIYPSKTKMGWKRVITKKNLLETNYIQTNSVLYKCYSNIINEFPDNIAPEDWYGHLLHSTQGNFGFMSDVMGVYRKHSGGIWFDVEKRHLKFGIKMVKFFYCAYKNISGNSKEYLQNIALPNIKSIMDTYYKNGYIKELLVLKETYPDLYEAAFRIGTKEHVKYKKYRKTSTLFLIISILLLILNIIQAVLGVL